MFAADNVFNLQNGWNLSIYKIKTLKAEQKIDYLIYLDVQIFEDRLILIKAKGYSKNEQPGVPKLMPSQESNKDPAKGILELDFVNQQVEDTKKDKVNFDISIVIDRSRLSENIKGVKVNAAENADIVLI